MNVEEVSNVVRNVEGWLTEGEGRLLWSFSKACTGAGVIVEVGSWKGKSNIWLANGSKEGANTKVYAIDPHTGAPEHQKMYGVVQTFEEFRKNIQTAGVDDLVVPLVHTSEEGSGLVAEPVEFIFIDGAHEYDMVRRDFEVWFPKVADGGVMAFHDTTGWEGPRKVVTESVYLSTRFRNVGFVDSITYGEKVDSNSLYDRIRNRGVLVLHRVFIALKSLKLPPRVRAWGKKLLRRGSGQPGGGQ